MSYDERLITFAPSYSRDAGFKSREYRQRALIENVHDFPQYLKLINHQFIGYSSKMLFTLHAIIFCCVNLENEEVVKQTTNETF